MKTFSRIAAVSLAIFSLAGCGSLQAYDQSLDAKAAAYKRNQLILDEQNQIQVGNLKAQQREQEIAAARAEGQKTQAQAAGEAQAAIEKAKGDAQSAIVSANASAQATVTQARADAEATLLKADAQSKANRELAVTMTPLLVQHEAIEKLSEKSIIYLPSSTIPYINMATPGALPSNHG